MTLIFERSQEGRRATSQAPLVRHDASDIPAQFRRKKSAVLPEVSELQVVRH